MSTRTALLNSTQPRWVADPTPAEPFGQRPERVRDKAPLSRAFIIATVLILGVMVAPTVRKRRLEFAD
jgi:hypothetical protein